MRGISDSRLPLWLGHALAKLHREPEAVEAYRLAVERAPDSVEAWFALALALRDTRQLDAAWAALARVLEIDPYARGRRLRSGAIGADGRAFGAGFYLVKLASAAAATVAAG